MYNENEKKINIIVAERDPSLSTMWRDILEAEGYKVYETQPNLRVQEAVIRSFEQNMLPVVIFDDASDQTYPGLDLPGTDSRQIGPLVSKMTLANLGNLRRGGLRFPLILVTSLDRQEEPSLPRQEADEVFIKPIDPKEILKTIERLTSSS